jgi:hypothetical protein
MAWAQGGQNQMFLKRGGSMSDEILHLEIAAVLQTLSKNAEMN